MTTHQKDLSLDARETEVTERQPWSKPAISDVSVSEHTEIGSTATSDSSHTSSTLS